MPSKQIYVKPYEVKGHYRTIHTRTFKFICAHCDSEATRTTYATTCPKYCDKCKDIKKKLGKKKQSSGEVIGVEVQEQKPEIKNHDLLNNTGIETVENPNEVVPLVNISDLKSEQVIEYINSLFLDVYNSKLESDLRHLLVDFWHERTDEQISKKRKLKIRHVKAISAKLLKQLSQALHENITRDNFCEIIGKHCLAYENLQRLNEEEK